MDAKLFGEIEIPRKPLAELVSDRIVTLIKEQELVAGDKLPNEFDLADILHVGRGTIREAVKLLVSRNVLVIERGRGTFVAAHTGVVEDPWGFAFAKDKARLAQDLLEIRIIVEPQVAAMAAQRATAEDIQHLVRLCDEVEKMILEGIPHLEKDVEYHTRIAQSTQNQVVPKLIPLINYSIGMFVEITEYSLNNETIATHRDILNAIIEHKPDVAQKAMEQHLMFNQERINKILKREKA